MSGVAACYAMRREGLVGTQSYVRNRNLVTRERAKLGPVSFSIVVGLLVLIVGLIYVNTGVKATSFDYELNRLNGEIAEMSAEVESLVVENTRLMAAAADADRNEVAMGMVDAKVSGAVAE